MNSFQIGDLAMIMGHNPYWDGCIVKIRTPLSRHLSISEKGHICEIAVFSPAMMDTARRPQYQKIGTEIGAWNASSLEHPKKFSALCPYCKGNSYCTVTTVTETGTAFKCSTHGACGLRHDSRTVKEAKWLTPTSKWAWFTHLPQPLQPAQPTIEYPKAAEPFCQCDVFNFGCSCAALEWEKSNG
jgi:hypothetical protein